MNYLLAPSVLCWVALAPLSAQAQAREEPAARVALVSGDKADGAGSVVALSEAKLSTAPGVILLERQAINKVLAEQKLSLSGVVEADQALTVGKLLAVDLFAVIEVGADGKEAAGLVVFDARTGV